MSMSLERRQDLSIEFIIRKKFEELGFEDIVDVDGSYLTPQLTIPTVAIDEGTLSTVKFEMGNRKGNYLRVWFIDIFANNKQQRNEFAYTVNEVLLANVPVYNYDEDDPSTWPDETEILGTLEWKRLDIEPVKVMAELVSKLYWRSQITYVASYSKPRFGG